MMAVVTTSRLSLDDIIRDLTELRPKGTSRFDEVTIPALEACVAALTEHPPPDLQAHHYDTALRVGIRAMGEGLAAECAAVLFGLAPDHLALHPRALRKRAAELCCDDLEATPATVDRFRKTQEPRILAALAAALLRTVEGDPGPESLAGQAAPSSLPDGRLIIDQDGWRPRTLPVLLVEPHRPGQLRELTWNEFGQGISTLRTQIHNYGTNLDVDLCVGINEAGLLMATLLASANFGRCSIGYVRTQSRGTSLRINIDESRLGPQLQDVGCVVICDYEVKTAHALSRVVEYLIEAGLPEQTPRLFAVMGALATEERTLAAIEVAALSRLACQPVLHAAGLADVFIGCLMASPGIDPPLALR